MKIKIFKPTTKTLIHNLAVLALIGFAFYLSRSFASLWFILLMTEGKFYQDKAAEHKSEIVDDICPCAEKCLIRDSFRYVCSRTHSVCHYDGINGIGSKYICGEFKEALGGN